MTIYCLYTDPTKIARVQTLTPKSHIEEPLWVSIPMSSNTGTLLLSESARSGEWHTTPKLGMTSMLAGYLKIETNRADIKTTLVEPGDILFVLDDSGEGHRSETTGSPPMLAILLSLDAPSLPKFTETFLDWPTDMVTNQPEN
jgi:hypothetical protein